MKNLYGILFGKHEKCDRLREYGVDGRIILKRIFKIYGLRLWIGFIWFRIGFNGWVF
jgi:hypothetical protein